jgi:hypothetical protein
MVVNVYEQKDVGEFLSVLFEKIENYLTWKLYPNVIGVFFFFFFNGFRYFFQVH